MNKCLTRVVGPLAHSMPPTEAFAVKADYEHNHGHNGIDIGVRVRTNTFRPVHVAVKCVMRQTREALIPPARPVAAGEGAAASLGYDLTLLPSVLALGAQPSPAVVKLEGSLNQQLLRGGRSGRRGHARNEERLGLSARRDSPFGPLVHEGLVVLLLLLLVHVQQSHQSLDSRQRAAIARVLRVEQRGGSAAGARQHAEAEGK
mmetsp:Transcript_28226/g.77158  ORF Transcript_28226/g.77158 Transcript_28226/m.77158 type:complete len:203 (-) Transcript_28226:213-821(-)